MDASRLARKSTCRFLIYMAKTMPSQGAAACLRASRRKEENCGLRSTEIDSAQSALRPASLTLPADPERLQAPPWISTLYARWAHFCNSQRCPTVCSASRAAPCGPRAFALSLSTGALGSTLAPAPELLLFPEPPHTRTRFPQVQAYT